MLSLQGYLLRLGNCGSPCFTRINSLSLSQPTFYQIDYRLYILESYLAAYALGRVVPDHTQTDF